VNLCQIKVSDICIDLCIVIGIKYLCVSKYDFVSYFSCSPIINDRSSIQGIYFKLLLQN